MILKRKNLFKQATIIAKALGYKQPNEAIRNIISRHRTEFEGLIHSANLAVSSGTAKDVFLNERGIYYFCLSKYLHTHYFVYRINTNCRVDNNDDNLSPTYFFILESGKNIIEKISQKTLQSLYYSDF